LLNSLASSIADMQKQIAALSEQVARGAPQSSAGPPPPVNMQQHPPPTHTAPPGRPLPTKQQLEDAFLPTLSAQNVGMTLALLTDHWPMTQYILPNPPGKAMVSQAILLTLLHRVSLLS